MELSAIILSRVLGFVETFDLSPRGTVFFPDLIAGLVEAFRFQKFPQTMEEMDESKGVTFTEGTWNGVSVFQLTLYNNAILLDTRAGTDESKRVLLEGLLWAANKFGLNYKEGMIRRWRYLSDLTVTTEVPLLVTHPALTNMCDAIGKHVSEILGEPLVFSPIRSTVDFDRHPRNVAMAAFDIQRRADTPFSENKYFSEAPLPTNVHFELLQRYETELVAASRR
jgi:hypothetical protein